MQDAARSSEFGVAGAGEEERWRAKRTGAEKAALRCMSCAEESCKRILVGRRRIR